ncbi:MAG: hypothetical protein ABEI99_06830 [Halobaculum sp.]
MVRGTRDRRCGYGGSTVTVGGNSGGDTVTDGCHETTDPERER